MKQSGSKTRHLSKLFNILRKAIPMYSEIFFKNLKEISANNLENLRLMIKTHESFFKVDVFDTKEITKKLKK